MEWTAILALALAAPFVLIPVGFIWYMNAGGLYQAIRQARLKKKMVCSINADCPPGHVCVNGKCVLAS